MVQLVWGKNLPSGRYLLDVGVCTVSHEPDEAAETARGPGRPRRGSEDKRERVLREAGALFARSGYAATSLADIAAAAQISKAGLLHHFDSKEELFVAVLERRDAEDLRGIHVDLGDVWDLLARWVELVGRNATNPAMVGLYTTMAASATDPRSPAHRWLHRHFERAVGVLECAFERGKAAGVVAPEAPARELARSVVAMSDGVQLQWLCARADVGVDDELGSVEAAHGGAVLDMAVLMRLHIEAIRAKWGLDERGKSR